MTHTYFEPHMDAAHQKSDLQIFQHLDKYSRFLPDEGRRETWTETVTRTVNALRKLSRNKFTDNIYQRIFDGIYKLDVLPSMRLLQMAGPQIDRVPESCYNCSFVGINCLDAIAEIQWLSMAGCGVAFSVEAHQISQLPVVQMPTGKSTNFIVEDTSEGWLYATKALLTALFDGADVIMDYSKIRSAGSRLHTKGGYASGPDALIEVHEFFRKIIQNAAGRKLTSLEAFDLSTKVADCGISGGVRRAAQLTLFDYDDEAMTTAKYDGFWRPENHPWRSNANISAVWPESVRLEDVKNMTHQLFNTGTGEPGIFKRDNALRTSPARRQFTPEQERNIGINPCSEVYLNDMQFCNLSAVVCRPDDTEEILIEKTKLATLIGDIQSLATGFKELRPEWTTNTEKDRLLGVSHIGWANCPLLYDAELLERLKAVCIDTDLWFSKIFDVPQSAAITAIKPSGNSSVLTGVGPGLNPIHFAHSIRNVTVNKDTSMHMFLEAQGVPRHDIPDRPYASMFSFPYKAPEDSIVLKDITALDQLANWKLAKNHLMEHNPSCSITYRNGEQEAIQQWIYENQDVIGGLAFFPSFESTYELLPIVEITEQQYDEFVAEFPEINWDNFSAYETGFDEMTATIECGGGRCDI